MCVTDSWAHMSIVHSILSLKLGVTANHGHPLALEIEEKPPARDVKIRRIAPWSWNDVMLLFMAMVITFLIWKLM